MLRCCGTLRHSTKLDQLWPDDLSFLVADAVKCLLTPCSSKGKILHVSMKIRLTLLIVPKYQSYEFRVTDYVESDTIRVFNSDNQAWLIN